MLLGWNCDLPLYMVYSHLNFYGMVAFSVYSWKLLMCFWSLLFFVLLILIPKKKNNQVTLGTTSSTGHFSHGKSSLGMRLILCTVHVSFLLFYFDVLTDEPPNNWKQIMLCILLYSFFNTQSCQHVWSRNVILGFSNQRGSLLKWGLLFYFGTFWFCSASKIFLTLSRYWATWK